MKERPIPFRGHAVRAILAGSQTMTRRVVRLRAGEIAHEGGDGSLHAVSNTTWGCCVERVIQCPYGVPGDMLWVRETWGWACGDHGGPICDARCVMYRADYNNGFHPDDGRWRPSIFMPRWASRLKLRIMSIRVERVQDITEADAKAEGVVPVPGTEGNSHSYRWPFCLLWDGINAASGHGWDANPWVWVVGFERVSQ